MRTRKIQLDLLRILSIFAMIMLHDAALDMSRVPPASSEWQWMNLYNSLGRFCVPTMVMLSGVFLLDPQKQVDIPLLYKKYIFRIVTAFIFWSALYSFFHYVFLPMTRDEPVSVARFIYQLIDGHYHLWFLYMIAGLYMITPFLRKMTDNSMLTRYFLALWALFAIALPFCGDLFQVVRIQVVLEKMNLFFVLGYSGYYLLGRYLYSHPLRKPYECFLYLLGIIGAVLTIVCTYLYKIRGDFTVSFYYYLSPNVFFFSTAVFVFFNQRVSKWKIPEGLQQKIVKLSSYTFGIYLIHDLFNTMFAFAGFSAIQFKPAFSVPAIALLVFGLSALIIHVLRKIPFFYQYLS